MQNPVNVPFRALFYPFALGSFLFLCAFGSCERDREPRPGPAPACRITRRYDATDTTRRVVYTYDAKKRLVALHHEQNGNAFSFWTFAYDAHHRVAGKTFADRQDDPVTLTVTYRYNAPGQMTAWVVMENGRHTEATRELDAEGNCTQLTVVATNLNTGVSSTSRHSYQYQAGNLVSSITDIGTDAERHHTYEYYAGQENKPGNCREWWGTPEGPGPSPSRDPLRTARTVSPKNPEVNPDTRAYTYAYNEKGFPTRITTVRTYAGTTTSSDALYAYDCE
jgi:YD repeat-containing protein